MQIADGQWTINKAKKNKLFDCPLPTDPKKPPDRKSFFFFYYYFFFLLLF